jgi:hypothetical protein
LSTLLPTTETPLSAYPAMFCALSWMELMTWSTALPIWSSPRLNGGPCSHTWTSCNALVEASESSVTWSATEGAIATMMPTNRATAASRTSEAARAGGHRCLRRNRVVGHSTVAISSPSTIGSRIDHSLPSTQNSATTAAEIRRNCADAIARVRAARWSLGPRPSVGAGASVTWAPGSTAGPPVTADAPAASGAAVSVSSRERPGRRSLIPSITTHMRGPDRAATIIAIKS